MGWIGKIVGGVAGLAASGPWGATLGVALGHLADLGLARFRRPGEPTEEERAQLQRVFYLAAFGAMGHLAKADGRVSRAAIELAEATMARMKLTAAHRQEAIIQFRRGKDAAFDLDATLSALRQANRGNRAVLEMFLQLQLHMAYVDGAPSPAVRDRLERIRRALGVPRMLFRRLENLARVQCQFAGDADRPARSGATRDQGTARPPRANASALAAAYALLGVGPADSDATVVRAYRRLLSQHHPDKLIARGLPEEALRAAAEKTQEIRRAYDRIRRARAA